MDKPTEKRFDLQQLFWIGTATFLAYCCMYMYRKPYTAGTFDDMQIWGIDYKVALVIAQIFGYALSKVIGISFISSLDLSKRLRSLTLLMIGAWLPLVGFAFSPPSYGPFWLFLNGLPLGMIWGIVFTYCEGRRLTEALTVILSVNFIITSGVAKSIGRWIIAQGITEQMMPMYVGLLFFPLLLLSLWMLHRIPPPSADEILLKTERKPMNSAERIGLLRQYGFPIALFVLLYLVLTLIRDIRDNFAVEIWSGLGYTDSPAIFSLSELPITLIVLLSLAFLYKINDNQKALMTNAGISLLGMLLIISTTWLWQMGWLSPVLWMIISGIGLFLPYILLNGIIFDRFIAKYRIAGNVGFVMYLSDATGYLGSVGIMLYKNFGNASIEWLPFYRSLCLVGGAAGVVICLMLLRYFRRAH